MKTNVKQQRKMQSKNGVLATKLLKAITPFQVGEVLNVQINALGNNNLGLAELPNGYTVVVPNVFLSDEVRVVIEAIFPDKPKYATAKVLEVLKKAQTSSTEQRIRAGEVFDVLITKEGPKGSGFVQLENNYPIVVPKTKVGDQVKIQVTRVKEDYAFANVVNSKQTKEETLTIQSNLVEGSKYHFILPKTAKQYNDYLIVKLNGSVVFIKMALGAKLGDTVRIQVMKVGSNYAVAKILKVSPLSKSEKFMYTKNRIQKMVQTGMHFGEKAIRCHANMRKYIWLKKKGQNQNRPFLKKDRYYINVLKTRRCLTKALKQLAKYAAKGQTFLFVGTKKAASALIARTALFTKTSFFVNTRWLGGMLTNWKTILKSISQIKPILKEKQRMIQTILERRQKIKQKFIQKVNLLRKRSQKLMTKGNILITKMKKNRTSFIEKSKSLLQKKNQILQTNQLFVQKYIELKVKKKQFIQQSQQLLQQGRLLGYQKQNLIKQFQNNQMKLQEFQQLFMIGQELAKLKQSAKQQGQEVCTVSFGKLTELNNQLNSAEWAVPMPPKEILNRMIQSMKIKYNFSNKENNMSQSISNRAKSEKNLTNTIVFSKLLNKFTAFLPFIQIYIENLLLRAQNLQMLLKTTDQNIVTVRSKLQDFKQLSEQIYIQLEKIGNKLLSQQKTLKTLRTKLRILAAEQRLLRFLPRLRYLTTPKEKMAETVQTLMKKFVDPKMTIPMEQIYDEKFQFTSKKIAAARKQKWQRLEKYFGGITKMAKMTKKQIYNNVAIIVGQQEEMNAVRECQKLGIQMFTLVDTNCNPRLSNHIIPANDDSRNSVKFVLEEMLTHIRLAQKLRQKVVKRKIKRYSMN